MTPSMKMRSQVTRTQWGHWGKGQRDWLREKQRQGVGLEREVGPTPGRQEGGR